MEALETLVCASISLVYLAVTLVPKSRRDCSSTCFEEFASFAPVSASPVVARLSRKADDSTLEAKGIALKSLVRNLPLQFLLRMQLCVAFGECFTSS